MSHFALLVKVIYDTWQNCLVLIFMVARFVVKAPPKTFTAIETDKVRSISVDIETEKNDKISHI